VSAFGIFTDGQRPWLAPTLPTTQGGGSRWGTAAPQISLTLAGEDGWGEAASTGIGGAHD